MSYPRELKGKVVARMMAPGDERISALAREFNVTEVTTRYAWRREALRVGGEDPVRGATPEQWSGAGKFAGVLETGSLPEAEVAKYCRRKGVRRAGAGVAGAVRGGVSAGGRRSESPRDLRRL